MVNSTTETPSLVQADAKKTRQRSPFLFPAYSFGTGLDIAKRIENDGAGVWSEETLAVNMGLSVKSSGFRLKCLTARQFGLVAKQGDKLITTPLAKAILKPTSEGEAPGNLRQAFLKMPLFQAVAERYKGQPLPQKDTFLNVLEREFGIDRERVKDAERMLMDSAREAQVLTQNADKTYLAVATTLSPTSAPSDQATQPTPPSTVEVGYRPPSNFGRVTMPDGSGFRVTEQDLANLEQEDFDKVWQVMGKIVRARGRRQSEEDN